MARYALIVGITEYSHLPRLSKAAQDAEAIARLLQQHGNFENIKPLPAHWLLAEKREAVSAQQLLTGELLGQALQTFLLEQADGKDALIYFSGHGITTTDSLGEQEGYLAASDCQVEQKNGQIIEQRYGISLDRLNRLIRRSNLSSLVVLLDCCHSGYFLERHLTEQTLTAFTGRQDYCLITASRRFEQAWEGEEYSVFTEAVLKGLSLNNQDEDGNVTGDRLFDSIARTLRQSGQEPIRMGIGRSLTLVSYRSHHITTEVNETCPYQGLEAFTAETKQFFFGRKAVIEQLRQKLEQSNFVALIGASGSGKSSVVRAGLIPWLAELGWQILPLIKPGFQPIAELKRSFASLFRRPQDIRQVHELVDAEDLSALVNLLPGSERLLLVVDQFEEVFTVCGEEPEQEKERRRFIQLLTQVENQRLAVVLTMRADFMEPCLSYTSLTQQLDHAVYIPPLEGEKLREAIAKPAQLQGYTLDPGLLALILRDVAKEKNCLPLLQFTLQKLWEPATHNKHRLTIEQYEQLGGVTGALDRHAQQICDRLTPQEQDWARRLCLKLVRTGEGTRDTRQRQLKRELVGLAGDDPQAQETLRDVLADLVDGRLLVTGEAAGEAWVDLAHEALMEGWQQFAEWRQSDREVRRLCDRMEDARREWEQSGQDVNYLLSRGLLAQVGVYKKELEPYLTISLQDFYSYSENHERDRDAALEAARTEAVLREQAVRVVSLLSISAIEGLALAIQSVGLNLEKSPKQLLSPVKDGLRRALETVEKSRFQGHKAAVLSVAFSPDGRTIISGSADKTLCLWDLQGNLLRQPFQGHESYVWSVAFSPDGRTIISGSADKTLCLWDLQGNLLRQPLQGHESHVLSVAYSPDNKVIASGSADQTIRLWNLQGNPVGRVFCGHESPILSVAFSPDSRMIVSGSVDRTIRLWDLQGNLLKPPFYGHKRDVWSVKFAPDGKKIISASGDGTLRLWDLEGNLLEQPFQGHRSGVLSVDFTPSGKTIVSSSADSTIRCWSLYGRQVGDRLRGHKDVTWAVACGPKDQMLVSGGDDKVLRLWNLEGNLIGRLSLKGHKNSVLSTKFSSDGTMIVSSSDDKTLRLWDLQGNLIGQPFQGHEETVRSVAFSPDGQTIVSGSKDRTLCLWDLQGNLIGQPFRGHEDIVTHVAFSPNGEIIVSCSDDKTIRLWDLQGRLLGQPFRGHEKAVNCVSFSPNGKTIVSGSDDKVLCLWNLQGDLIGQPFQGHEDAIWSVEFSPDGQTIVSSSDDKTLRLWNLQGDSITQPFRGHEDSVRTVAFSPDGQMVLSGSWDRTLRLWDLRGNSVGQPFCEHTDYVASVAFSPDGQTIVSGSWDKTLRLWRGGTWRDWLEVCCNRIRYHPYFTNPTTEESRSACEVCRKCVWEKDGKTEV